MDIWIVGTSNQLFKEVLKFKQYFDRNKVVTGKTPFFVVHFVLTILFVLTLVFDMTILYENDAFSIFSIFSISVFN